MAAEYAIGDMLWLRRDDDTNDPIALVLVSIHCSEDISLPGARWRPRLSRGLASDWISASEKFEELPL